MESPERLLFSAAQHNNLPLLRQTLQHPRLNPNWRNPGEGWNFMTALHIACLNGYHQVIEELLRHPRINLNTINIYGESVFFTVCELGDASLVELLLADQRVLVNLKTHKGQTSAWEACFQGHVEVVELLLESGRDIDWLDVTGPDHWEPNSTPLAIARKENNTAIVELLVAALNHEKKQLAPRTSRNPVEDKGGILQGRTPESMMATVTGM